MDDVQSPDGPRPEVPGNPVSPSRAGRRQLIGWVAALAVVGGLVGGAWFGAVRVRESAARSS
jgi:hypothetical protein